ncbi:MAG: MFS transporter [Bryobacterales bacterium]|nr:MFS transporter [Bryobacterales bacterium]
MPLTHPTEQNRTTWFGWWRESSPDARKALAAASLGWMLDSFDVMLYSLVLAALMADLDLAKAEAGVLGSITLVAAAVGGLAFGHIADRFGRTRAMMASMLIYATFTAACGLANNFVQLAVFRVFLGFGMGGEWASGAALVSETWPAKHRGKALGFMQSSWAVGYALAAIVTAVVLPVAGWRAVFFVGVLPAFATLWIRRNVKESDAWLTGRVHAAPIFAGFREIFSPAYRRVTIAITLMNSCTLFAWWGFNLWVPAYLSLPEASGGIGLSARVMSALIVFMQVGMWFGYVTFGFVSDKVGRKPSYITYLLMAAALLLLYSATRNPWLLLALGPFVAFFGTGYYTGLGTVTAEYFPTHIRATAQGFTYNLGRVASAFAPFTVGSLAELEGFGVAFRVLAVAFVMASALWFWIPETKGREFR